MPVLSHAASIRASVTMPAVKTAVHSRRCPQRGNQSAILRPANAWAHTHRMSRPNPTPVTAMGASIWSSGWGGFQPGMYGPHELTCAVCWFTTTVMSR